jgi:HlyD family secretion protein
MIIAQLDDALYQAAVGEANAQVISAKAGIQLSKANLEQLKAKLLQAQRDWDRAKKLGPSEALAQSSYDAYQSAYEVAKANVAVGEAEILQADANLTQVEKALWRAQRNLEYCTITSPVKGTVLDRRVSIGQTVNAGNTTPSLFLIAKDLSRMQIWVSVNEADVTSVYKGQPVSFTVDALPDQTFKGEVHRIRPNASMTQNVVTYTVEISVDNSDGQLRPYMTANARFEVHKRENVLMVPIAAINWTPTVAQVAPEYRETAGNGHANGNGAAPANGASRSPVTGPDGAKPPATSQPAQAMVAVALTPAVLYVKEGQYVKPVYVLAGISDGAHTEVMGEGLSEGMEVVTGVETGDAAPFGQAPPSGGDAASSGTSSDVSNPLTPKMPARPKNVGGGGPPM